MSSSVVETVRTIPLIIKKGNSRNHIPMDTDDNSGFPFERETDRDGHFRSQLDDLAKRHPELAEHLGSFSRRRQSGGGDADDFHRRFERPFAGQFERFGFPFDRDNFDPEQYAQQFYQQHPEFHRSQPHPEFQHSQHHPEFQQNQQQHPEFQHSQQHPEFQHSQQHPEFQHHQQHPEFQQPQSQSYQHQPENQQNSSYQYQPQPEFQQPQQSQPQFAAPEYSENLCSTPEKDRGNIQQSNTIDLGQKQEPVNDRNQRSMSAPPAEKGQRFTSSINIPVNQPCEEENMAQADGKTMERIIPIHIEGRDEPVLPKTAPATFSQPYQSYSAGAAQPERIFGQRPEQFTQFVNREPRQFDKWQRPGFEQMHQGFAPDDLPKQQRYQQQNIPPYYQQQQQRSTPQPQQQYVPPQPQPKHDIPIPVQREVPHTKQQAPEPEMVPPQEPPQTKQANQSHMPKTPVEQIQDIQKDVSGLMIQVEQFGGKPKDKQYLYLDEMLTRNLLKLDNIDTQGQESIRSARKEAIKCIEKAISVLESKAAANVAPKTEEKMEVEEKPREQSTENCENKQTEVQNMETEQPAAEVKAGENGPQPMEFSPESISQQSNPNENKEEKEPPSTENAQPVDPTIENRAVLVLSENKETPKVEENIEPMETKEHSSSVPTTIEEVPKPDESSEGQEKNLPVAEAVKKFEGVEDEKKDEIKSEENIGVQGEKVAEESKGKVVDNNEQKMEDKTEEKKEKKKGKKKVEKKSN